MEICYYRGCEISTSVGPGPRLSPPVIATLSLGVIAALGNLFGAAVALSLDRNRDAARPSRLSEAILRGLLPLGAGFLLAITLLEMIPDALAYCRPISLAGPLILGGYLLLHFVEGRVGGHAHLPTPSTTEMTETEAHAGPLVSPRLVRTALVGLTLHAFFDGVAVGSGTAMSSSLGLLLVVAIVLHKIPEGATLASLVLLSGMGRRLAIALPLLLGLATVAGTAAVLLISRGAVAGSLAFASGVTLYVAATDLIPHANHARRTWRDSGWVYAGVGVFALTDLLVRRAGLP